MCNLYWKLLFQLFACYVYSRVNCSRTCHLDSPAEPAILVRSSSLHNCLKTYCRPITAKVNMAMRVLSVLPLMVGVPDHIAFGAIITMGQGACLNGTRLPTQ